MAAICHSFWRLLSVFYFLFCSSEEIWNGTGTESWAKFHPVTYFYLWCAFIFCNVSPRPPPPSDYDPIYYQSSLINTKNKHHTSFIRPEILKKNPSSVSLCNAARLLSRHPTFLRGLVQWRPLALGFSSREKWTCRVGPAEVNPSVTWSDGWARETRMHKHRTTDW